MRAPCYVDLALQITNASAPPSPPRSEAREACQPHVAKTTPTGRCVGNCATKALTTIGHPASRLESTGTLQPNFAARPLQGSCSDFCGLAGLRACLYVHLGCAHLIRRERGDVRLCGAVNLACACPLPHMHRFCLPVAAHAPFLLARCRTCTLHYSKELSVRNRPSWASQPVSKKLAPQPAGF